MSVPCGVLVLGRSSANGSLGRWWRGSRASEGRDRSHVHAGGTRAWRNVCSAVGRGGGTEGCGSGWFHGGRKDVALDVGRVGFPGAPLEQNAGYHCLRVQTHHHHSRYPKSRLFGYLPDLPYVISCMNPVVMMMRSSPTSPRLYPAVQAHSIAEDPSQAKLQRWVPR